MHNHKGEIATLLTLGLVLVGTLITLGTSLFVSNNKTNFASNSRAADYGGKACCFCQKGIIRLYASSTAQENLGPCTTAKYGSAYGASSWGYCNDNLGSYEGGECKASGGGGGGGTPAPGATLTPEDCKNTTTVPKADPDNCTDFNSGTTIYPSHELSTKGNLIFDGKDCSGEGKSINDAEDSFCAALNSGNCKSWDCKKVKSEWKSQDLWKNYLNGTTYYYSSDVNCNTSGYEADSAELKNYCAPEAAPTCEETTCGVVVSNVDPSSADKPIYYMSNDDAKYYKKIKNGICETIISDINKECPIASTPTPTPYKVVDDSSDEIWSNKDYISCNKNGIRSDSVLRDSFIKDCYEGKKTVPNFEGCPYTVMKSDAGLDIYDHLYCCRIKC